VNPAPKAATNTSAPRWIPHAVIQVLVDEARSAIVILTNHPAASLSSFSSMRLCLVLFL